MDEKNGSFVFDNDTSANSNSPRGFNLDEDMVVVIPVVTIGLLIVALTIVSNCSNKNKTYKCYIYFICFICYSSL